MHYTRLLPQKPLRHCNYISHTFQKTAKPFVQVLQALMQSLTDSGDNPVGSWDERFKIKEKLTMPHKRAERKARRGV